MCTYAYTHIHAHTRTHTHTHTYIYISENMAVRSLSRGRVTNQLEGLVVHVFPREELLNKFTNVHET